VSDPQGPRLPEPTLGILVAHFFMQAMIEVGLAPNPVTGKRAVSPARARFTLGLLRVLQERTRGNLSSAEQAEIESCIVQVEAALAAAQSASERNSAAEDAPDTSAT
jgi:hypothetical protein